MVLTMKIENDNNNIIFLLADTQYEIAATMMRMQEVLRFIG